MSAVGGALLHLLWQATLVGLATALALRVAGPAAAKARYRLALGALALIALAPLATAARRSGVLAGWGVATAGPVMRQTESPAPSVPALPSDRHVATAAAVRSVPAGHAGSPDSSRRGDPLVWLAALWVVGVAWQLSRLAGGIVQVYRVRALAGPAPAWLTAMAQDLGRRMAFREAPVLLSERTDSPFASGMFRPVVVLPYGLADELTPGQLRAVLAHELAHVQRHDYAVNLAQRVLEALVPFHPAVRWLSKVARDEREHCCDELAAAAVGDRRAVAGTLLALELARRAESPALLPAAAGGSLLCRVERLVAGEPSGRHRWAFAAFAVLLTGGAALLLATPTVRGAASSSVPPNRAGPVVWAGGLQAGERLRVRNLVGPIRVVRAASPTGIVRGSVRGVPQSGFSFQVTRQEDGVTVCVVRPGLGRCDAEGYTWTGLPEELQRASIELTVELPAGVRVTAATFEGDLDLAGIDSDAEARTGSGSIAAQLAERSGPGPDRTFDLHTGEGVVRVALPRTFGGTLDARLSNGQVVHDSTVLTPGTASARLRTSLGPGNDRLRVSSGGGDLVLTRS